MSYEAPTYDELLKTLNSLKANLDAYLGRYVPPDPATIFQIGESLLKEKYLEKKKLKTPTMVGSVVNQVTTFWGFWPGKSEANLETTLNQTRLDQIEMIRLITEMISKEASKDKSLILAGSMIILGALLHRYLRVQGSYNYAALKLAGSKEEDSCLYLAIEELLKIIKSGSEQKNELDAQTALTCLLAYRDYLTPEIAWTKFAYISKNKDFFNQLNSLIEVYIKEAKPIQKQLQYLPFIFSINDNLQYLGEVELPSVFEQISSFLKQTFKKRFSEKENLAKTTLDLNSADIKHCLHELAIEPANVKLSVENILTSFKDQGAMITETGEVEFIKQTTVGEIVEKTSLSSYLQMLWQQFQYACLLGAYTMVLKQTSQEKMGKIDVKPEMKALHDVIKKALKIDDKNKLDLRTSTYTLGCLEQLINLPDLKINAEAWNGIELMKTNLLQLLRPTEEKSISASSSLVNKAFS